MEVSHNVTWETRRRGGRYYTRSRRVGGRVVREYVGSGAVGELAAEVDAMERAERLARCSEWRQQCGEARDVRDALAALEARSRQWVSDTLSAEGFHRHKGQWRRRREHGGRG